MWQYFNPIFEYEKIFSDFDWPWAGHKYFAYDFIRNIKPNTIVELGTHRGTSFFSMCQAVKDAHLSSKLFAIDTWKGDEQAGFYDKSIFIDVKKIKQTYYNSLNISLLKTTFDKAMFKFEKNSIDLLHIDGLHTYDAVKHDFENWFDKVKKDGIVMFHDTSEKRDDFGVYKLWDELKVKYQTIEFSHSHGLGILFKKKNKKNSFINFQQVWKLYYANKAKNIILKKQIEATKNDPIMNKDVEKITSDFNHMKKENISLQKQIKLSKIQVKNLSQILNNIKSAKAFKIWQKYCKIRDNFLKK